MNSNTKRLTELDRLRSLNSNTALGRPVRAMRYHTYHTNFWRRTLDRSCG